jgi:hypothetical protein
MSVFKFAILVFLRVIDLNKIKQFKASFSMKIDTGQVIRLITLVVIVSKLFQKWLVKNSDKKIFQLPIRIMWHAVRYRYIEVVGRVRTWP